ncbi:MAG: gliding motility-associated ABC transporter substrate-binding protein GldG [Paludibacteraceae bacterium]
MNRFLKENIILFALAIGLIWVSHYYFFRIDLTSDKRYSISKSTKQLMKNVTEPMEITVYLTGDLNPGFLRLKKATAEMIHELSMYANTPPNIHYQNPSEAESDERRKENYLEMERRGMVATSIYEKDKEGKIIQKIVYPWIKISYRGKTLSVNILKNLRGLSGEENLNASVENLEFTMIDAIRRLVNTQIAKIAFIEGHGELDEIYTYDISKTLSKYFQIDRGIIENDISVLDSYRAIIIAKPLTAFSEKDKFVIDQYIMRGGRVLWLVDGVRISQESFSTQGRSPAIGLDLNLSDMFFKYGVRINPVLLEDVQSVHVPVNVASGGEQPHFESMPWTLAPLLLTSNEHAITRNIPQVKASFCSMIDMVGDMKNLQKTLLIATSTNTHILQTPVDVSLSDIRDLKDNNYFSKAYVPVGVVLEGVFLSNFENRMPPPDIVNPPTIKRESEPTRQIFVACGNIIKNDVERQSDSIRALPLGFDRFMNQQFGNNELIANAVLYLTDRDGWMNLRNRTTKWRLLNQKVVVAERAKWQTVNIVLPLLLLIMAGFAYQILRKRKYAR